MDEDISIRITKAELHDPYIEETLSIERATRGPSPSAEREIVKTYIWMNPIFYTALAGFIGALLAWFFVEPMIIKTGNNEEGIGLFLLIPVASSMIGLFIGLIEGAMSQNFIKAIRCGAIGFSIGLVWGFIGTILGSIAINIIQAIIAPIFIRFPLKLDPSDPLAMTTPGFFFVSICGRSVAWTIVGAGMGVGQGIALKSKKLILNGIVGGLLGGFVGGLLFDPLGFLILKYGSSELSGSVSRVVGLSCIGLMIGTFIGLVENLTKKAWFVMKFGPLKGKNFVIYHNPTVIGSSPKCDIYIFKDASVEPKHAEIRQMGNKFELLDMNTPMGIYVNSKRINKKHILENNDVIKIGESSLEFKQKVR